MTRLLTKFFYFFLLKIYRSSGKNFRTVIVIGDNKSAQDVVSIFNDKQYLGYRFSGYFSDNKKSSSISSDENELAKKLSSSMAAKV